jgi:hypothetical protein
VLAATAAAFAVTLACAWLLLPARVPVALQEGLVLDRWQYVVGVGLGGWALAVGSGGLGIAVDSLARTIGSGAAGPSDLEGLLEAWVLLCAAVVVWLQVAAGSGTPGWLPWAQVAVVLAGFTGAAVLLGARALGVRRRR